MLINTLYYVRHYIVIIVSTFLLSCSAEKSAILNRAFHNTTSHYNAYFYSRDHVRNVERIIESSIENDYDHILPIFPTIDSTLSNSYKTDIDQAIKMASIAIQRHANSKWVDDSYLLVGLARLYSLDYVNAILTFKYINKNSHDDNTRHLALVHLFKTFIDYEEYDKATEVSDFLKKEKLNTSNLKLLNLYRGYYYQKRGDLDNMLRNLIETVPVLSNHDGKGRIFFIVGQNYQELGFDAEAYNYYRKCLATNPDYELDFYTRLRMAQVTQLNENSDVRTVRKYLRKLLKDKKNEEFRDKIYYEMAEFEARQNNLDKAIEYYNSSIRSGQKNKRQKGMSYLKLGKIYYDTLRNYKLAEAYYDSTIQTLPKDFEGYAEIKNRQSILSNFVKQLNTIELQDSLITLSKMDTSDLKVMFTRYLEEKSLQEELNQKKTTRQATTSSGNIFDTPQENGTSKWYFGNPTAISMGQTEFRRIWGDIELSDNWRRSVKESTDLVDENEPDNIAQSNESADKNNPSPLSNSDNLEQLMAAVPRTTEQLTEAHKKIEVAYYNLGKIYHFDLEESEHAAETFEVLLNRYDTTIYKPEVMYLLYLIYKESGNDRHFTYKDKILTDYSQTIYAKLILNPNYTEESSIASEYLKVLYKDAYTYYTLGNFAESRKILNDALSQHDDLPISANFKLLEVLIIGKTEDITKYQYELSHFIETNQDSDLVPYAQTLLAASRDFQERTIKAKGIKFIEYFEQEHYFIVVYENKNKKLIDLLSTTLDSFNVSYFKDQKLITSNLILDQEKNITMVSEFKGAKSSLKYYEQFMLDPDIKTRLPMNELQLFTITKDNFNLFYQTKELKGYLKFFNIHYQ